jgi:hypothetical protein
MVRVFFCPLVARSGSQPPPRDRSAMGHKADLGTLVDAVQRCVIIPNDPALPKFVQDCVGKYVYMPDKSWKAAGTCTDNIRADKKYETWEEGSHLKGIGTGKYEGASGGAPYTYENLSDTIAGGTYKGQFVLPQGWADTICG